MQQADQQQNAPEPAQSAAEPNLPTETAASAEAVPPAGPGFEEHLALLQQEAAELKDAWLRAKAETENVRRRGEERVAAAQKFAVESFASELLAVKDSLEAALAVESGTLESYKSGVEITLRQLAAAFTKFNVVEINPVGEKFDPHKHQAMAMVQADQEPNTVVAVMQKGYSLNERVLRPALVTVASPKPSA